jgi:hypothetical protein
MSELPQYSKLTAYVDSGVKVTWTQVQFALAEIKYRKEGKEDEAAIQRHFRHKMESSIGIPSLDEFVE